MLFSNKKEVSLLTICFVIIVSISINFPPNQVLGFHLSFGHRLLKSASNPQLNPASTLIRPIECRNANNQTEVGICMFSIDCMQNKGTPLSVCKHNYFVGTCCRLPDYNNFVGIVYDLRDTEQSNLMLEARRANFAANIMSPPATTTLASTGSAQQPSSNQILAGGEDLSRSAGQPSETIASMAPAASAATTTTSISTAAPSSTTRDDLEARYVISSTSLFSSTQQPQSTGSTEKHQVVGESARNADGSLAPIATLVSSENLLGAHRQQIVVPSELDSFQIQSNLAPVVANAANGSSAPQAQSVTSALETATGNGQQNAYELIKDSGASDNKMVDAIAVTPASHSSQQQFNLINEQQQLEPSKGPLPAEGTKQQQPHGGVYLLDDQLQQQQQTLHSQQTIVFANNHQQSMAASTLKPFSGSSSSVQFPQSSSVPPTSDQEFTLSSAPPHSLSQAPDPASTGTGYSSSQSTAGSGGWTPEQSSRVTSTLQQTTTNQPSSQQPVVSSTSGQPQSSHVDLVSSPSSSPSPSQIQVQTTTPFTSSLSTALLPSVSSRPYSPTEEPALTSPAQSSSPAASSPLVSTNQTATTNFSSPPISTSAPSQRPPVPTSGATSPQRPTPVQPAAFGQLYNNQHSAAANLDAAAGYHGGQSTGRPLGPSSLMGLHAATKIVTGGSASPNNLIPGLSGLQSAILSHIPFKLASGLSSGLSSYLQAAMKPSSIGSRPLLSSNTAPALQFQQAAGSGTRAPVANQTVGGSQAAGNYSSSNLRFPGPATASVATSSPVASSGSHNDQLPLSATGTGGILSASSGNSSLLPVGPNGHSHSSDVVRDALLVCGRPQQVPNLAQLEGKRRVARIVGGNQSMFGQWPWMVSLRQWRKGAFLHKCGAALLNENWAITAAHCVENVKAADLLLRLGEFDVSNQEEPYPYIERRVKSVVSHPSFDPKTFEYDLALLRFAEPVRYERNIVPVCVPSGNDTYVDRMATVIGWGRLYEDGPLPDVIQHVDVPIITNNECEKMYKNAGYIEEIPEMFICAGISKGGRDSCEGDSGGPLTMVDHDGRSYLVGIISWGIGCALPSQPGVYTRITAFSGWINQITAY